MNYSAKILDRLGASPDFTEIVLAPGAPVVERSPAGLAVAIPALVSPHEVRDTLLTFASHSRSASPAELPPHGTFSFGIHGLGRFRVSYVTQRGSLALTVQKVPSAVPALEEVLAPDAPLEAIGAALAHPGGGILLVTGPSAPRTVLFAYAALRRINETLSRVIVAVEPSLSFLLGHGKSVVVQTELCADSDSLAAGLRAAAQLRPDVVFSRDLRSRDEFSAALETAESGALVLLALSAPEPAAAFERIRSALGPAAGLFERLTLALIRLESHDGGRLRAALSTGAAVWRQD